MFTTRQESTNEAFPVDGLIHVVFFKCLPRVRQRLAHRQKGAWPAFACRDLFSEAPVNYV